MSRLSPETDTHYRGDPSVIKTTLYRPARSGWPPCSYRLNDISTSTVPADPPNGDHHGNTYQSISDRLVNTGRPIELGVGMGGVHSGIPA